MYNQSDYPNFYALAATLTGETEFTCWDYILASENAKNNVPSYLYRYVGYPLAPL